MRRARGCKAGMPQSEQDTSEAAGMRKGVAVITWAPLHVESPAPRDAAGRWGGRLGLRCKMLCRHILNLQIRKGRTPETA